MPARSPNELSAIDAARAIAAGELTSEALVGACLARIGEREETVRAWAAIDEDAAISAARICDSKPARGPLHGVPVGFKDIVDTADLPTGYGSPIYTGHRPRTDAACVALIRRAGGIVLGKTVTTEFAFSEPGRTRNPHDPEHTPGGSSSGSAAGVADLMVPLAFGTQTGGSVIRPASFCGVVGYKASFGQLSFAGTKQLAPSLDTLGTMSRCVADVALVRAAMLGAPATVREIDRPPRLGLCRTPWWSEADSATHDAVTTAAAALANAGARVQEIDLGEAFAALGDANQTIMTFEGCRALAWELTHRPHQLSPRLKAALEPARDTPYETYVEARRIATRCRAGLVHRLDGLDALLVPAAVGEAPAGFESTGDAVFNRPWTTVGAPCVTLPGHRGPNGLPVGVQLVGEPDGDEALLSTARWVETALGAAGDR